jgi:hypothetical protein
MRGDWVDFLKKEESICSCKLRFSTEGRIGTNDNSKLQETLKGAQLVKEEN